MWLIILGALGFSLGGAAAGYVLLNFEFPLAFVIEGLLGGIALGFAHPNRKLVWRLAAGASLGAGVGFLAGSFIALVIFDGYHVPELIAGLLLGLITAAFLGNYRRFLPLAFAGVIGYIIGDAVLDAFGHVFYIKINETAGQAGWAAISGALAGLFHGAFLGLGIFAAEKKETK